MAQKPSRKLLDQVGDAARLKHYSYRTEQAYKDWIKRFILFHGKRHPKDRSAELWANRKSTRRGNFRLPSLRLAGTVFHANF